MKLLKPIESAYNFRLGIIRMLTKGANDVNDEKLKKLRNDYTQLETKDEIQDFEIHMRYKKNLRKTKLLFFFIMFGFLTSILLTLAGTNKIDFLNEATWTTSNLTYCAIIFFLQSIIYIVTSRESIIKEKYYNHYWGFKIAQYIIVTSSIYYNFRFFMMYFKDMNQLEIIITALICAGLDIVTIKLIALRNDMKNNITSTKNEYKIFKDNKDKVKDVKDKDILKNNVLKNENENTDIKIKDNIKDNENDKTSLNNKQDISLTEKSHKINLEKYPKDNPKDIKKDIKNNLKIIDMRFIEAAKFIVNEFNEDELIEWKKVKDYTQIEDEYNLKKLRTYLKNKNIIRTSGKKSYRNKCPNNILKEIKMS